MNEPRYTMRATRAVPELGIEQGDLLTLNPEDEPSEWLAIHRTIRTQAHHIVMTAIVTGQLRLLDRSQFAEVTNAVATAGMRSVGILPALPPSPPSRPPALPIPDGPIDVDAAIADLATTDWHRGPAEKGIADVVDRDTYQEHQRKLRRLRRLRWETPKSCKVCGEEFQPTVEQQATCGTCRKAGRRRCARCHEVFAVTRSRAMTCEPCARKRR